MRLPLEGAALAGRGKRLARAGGIAGGAHAERRCGRDAVAYCVRVRVGVGGRGLRGGEGEQAPAQRARVGGRNVEADQLPKRRGAAKVLCGTSGYFRVLPGSTSAGGRVRAGCAARAYICSTHASM